MIWPVLAFLAFHADPPLADAARFPTFLECQDNLAFNRAYVCYLEGRLAWEADQEAGAESISEAKQLRAVWQVLWHVQHPHHADCCRHESLRELKQLLGDEAYYAGRMPPHVPLWRFQEIP